MAEVSGLVVSVRKDGQGFKVGDDWFTMTSGSKPPVPPEWKSTVVVNYTDGIDGAKRHQRWVDSWQAEGASLGASRANDSVAGHSPGSTDWDDRQESIRRQAVMNTTVAIWTLAERLGASSQATLAARVDVISALALELRREMMRDFLALETFARNGGSRMVEAAIEMGAKVENISDDTAAWATEPRTEEQVAEIRRLLKERGLPESWVREQGFTMPGKQPTKLAAFNALQKLREMVVI